MAIKIGKKKLLGRDSNPGRATDAEAGPPFTLDDTTKHNRFYR